jgi:hypothetical protein
MEGSDRPPTFWRRCDRAFWPYFDVLNVAIQQVFPNGLAAEADAVGTMKHRPQIQEGRAIYERRCTVEPVWNHQIRCWAFAGFTLSS